MSTLFTCGDRGPSFYTHNVGRLLRRHLCYIFTYQIFFVSSHVCFRTVTTGSRTENRLKRVEVNREDFPISSRRSMRQIHVAAYGRQVECVLFTFNSSRIAPPNFVAFQNSPFSGGWSYGTHNLGFLSQSQTFDGSVGLARSRNLLCKDFSSMLGRKPLHSRITFLS